MTEPRKFVNTHTTFTGDKFWPKTVSGITWSIVREAAPIYTMGGTNAPYRRGLRSVAGHIIFLREMVLPKPFDLQITWENEESGKPVTRMIYGIEVLVDAEPVDKVKADESYSFIARQIGPIVNV